LWKNSGIVQQKADEAAKGGELKGFPGFFVLPEKSTGKVSAGAAAGKPTKKRKLPENNKDEEGDEEKVEIFFTKQHIPGAIQRSGTRLQRSVIPTTAFLDLTESPNVPLLASMVCATPISARTCSSKDTTSGSGGGGGGMRAPHPNAEDAAGRRYVLPPADVARREDVLPHAEAALRVDEVTEDSEEEEMRRE
jgi:hypothetical protein